MLPISPDDGRSNRPWLTTKSVLDALQDSSLALINDGHTYLLLSTLRPNMLLDSSKPIFHLHFRKPNDEKLKLRLEAINGGQRRVMLH
jgi:hypothetical protein